MPAERRLVRGKIAVPSLRSRAHPRRRVDELIGSALDRTPILVVTATAGSGKTTAVVGALRTLDSPTAWLTLDRSDVSAGRFLTYIEASLRGALPETLPAATTALGQGVNHAEAAALLAEAIGERAVTVVLDEVERIADSPAALETLAQFVRYLPERARVILISRQDVPLQLGREEIAGRVGRIGEIDLALTVDEARQALDGIARTEVDAAAAVAATGGWVTGVLFESWRSSEHVHGSGGEADPLRSYLSSEIMSTLPAHLRDFLVRTSILDEVTALRAEALGIAEPSSMLSALRERHLPVGFGDAAVMRCHPRFREYLQELFRGLEPSTQRGIRGAHADLLVLEGRDEEAVDEYLRAGDIAQAEDIAVNVMLIVVRRLDIDLVSGWLAAFRRRRIESSATMTSAELLVALEREAYGRGVECADRLRRIVGADSRERLDPGLVGAMAWCYLLTGRIEAAQEILDGAKPDPQTDVMRFAVGVELVDSPVHYRDRPNNSNCEVDGMLARIDLAHGRFERLVDPISRYDAVQLSRFGALTGLGRLEEAQEMLSESSVTGWTRVRMTAELLAECERPEEAWAALIGGRERLNKTGSCLFRIFAMLTEAMLALRFGRDTSLATAVLQAVEKEPTALRRVRVLEQLALWRGLIGLVDRDDEKAAAHLREAVRLMTEWDRLLFLPRAAVYLAEAEWRLNNETASDEAADLALRSADRTGSRHTLIRVLREFPSVLSRRLDASIDPDSDWHELGRSLLTFVEGPAVTRVAMARVIEFGEPGIVVDGRLHRVKLIKSVELLGYLACRDGIARRKDLIASLFDSRNDKSASAYLRMAVNGVRAVAGDDCLSVDSTTLRWTAGAIDSEFTLLRKSYARLRNVRGAQRFALAMEAMVGLPSGEYLAGSRSTWAAEQRERWCNLVLDVRHAAAEAAYEVADYGLAHVLVDDVLDQDPYRERGWRLKMRVAGAVGDGDRVIAAYRACESALDEIQITPADSTRRLLQQLRT